MIKRLIQFISIALFILILGACSNSMNGMNYNNMNMDEEREVTSEDTTTKGLQQTVSTEKIELNEFTLVAQERKHTLTEGIDIQAWTFNGSVPGPEIRVQEGEEVKIILKNELKDPVTIHWHGIPVPNNMDGIPGVTMNAVQPGDSFIYEFKTTVPGTYWYHSHQDGVNQLDKGLYGSFIIEGKNDEEVDKDYTLVLDEWMSDTDSDRFRMGHDMGNMYDIFTVNGKNGKDVLPLLVNEGDKVRLRLVNAGFMSHKIHLHGHEFKVTGTDGQEINDPELIKDQLISIAPGERYDIEFTTDNLGEWLLESHGDMEGTDGMKVPIKYESFDGASTDKSNQQEKLKLFDLTSYGKEGSGGFTLDQEYDLSYTMDLNTGMSSRGMVYTINDKTFPKTENIKVNEGDLVKVKLENNSTIDDHPMHLHGHFFQVLSKNGKPVQGSPIIKDTLNLKPGDEYVVAFKADNPGNWLFHCHDLHHASAGMVTQVTYDGFKPQFTPNPNANNQPE
ncbi:multicopper oxidase family protein [Paenisporosarcina sp. TG-14]|uniref:multicopper oxidase family protein n=1 Tax=Paenisporosarcina sp. TG-14 TaxID=1231057 RepID=UPI0002DE6508|nr:multicopper oxidase family protein [Paenisporosarcina sp. TG-14]